jgi:hypothetical protein
VRRIKTDSLLFSEEEEAAALDGVGAGAGEVRGGRDAAEEDEPVPEGEEGTFFLVLSGHMDFSDPGFSAIC